MFTGLLDRNIYGREHLSMLILANFTSFPVCTWDPGGPGIGLLIGIAFLIGLLNVIFSCCIGWFRRSWRLFFIHLALSLAFPGLLVVSLGQPVGSFFLVALGLHTIGLFFTFVFEGVRKFKKWVNAES